MKKLFFILLILAIAISGCSLTKNTGRPTRIKTLGSHKYKQTYDNGNIKVKGRKKIRYEHLGCLGKRPVEKRTGKWKYYTEDGNLEKIVWYKNDESVKVKYKIQVEKSDSTLSNSTEQEQPIKRSYKLIYELEVYELINDSTLSENPINLPVIYQNTDTLSLADYILEQSWNNPKYCESNISNITSVYYYNSKVDSTGKFSEFNVNSNKYISPIQSWNSTSCTESFRKTLNNAVSPIEILDSQYLNKDVCFRLRVWLKLW